MGVILQKLGEVQWNRPNVHTESLNTDVSSSIRGETNSHVYIANRVWVKNVK
jgi:hypothetical protein